MSQNVLIPPRSKVPLGQNVLIPPSCILLTWKYTPKKQNETKTKNKKAKATKLPILTMPVKNDGTTKKPWLFPMKILYEMLVSLSPQTKS